MSDDTDKRFSDDEARAILARAIEIESRAPLTTIDDLRAIAADVGVSAASLEAALREETTALESRRATADERAATIAAASGVPLGLAAGALFTATATSGAAALGLLGLGLGGLAASGALVAFHGASGTLPSFHRKNLALWGGVAAGSLVSAMLMDGEVTRLPMLIAAGWSLRGWVATSILGSAAMIAVRRARRPSGTDAGGTDISGVSGDGRWTALAKRVRGWIGQPLRRDIVRGAGTRRFQSV